MSFCEHGLIPPESCFWVIPTLCRPLNLLDPAVLLNSLHRRSRQMVCQERFDHLLGSRTKGIDQKRSEIPGNMQRSFTVHRANGCVVFRVFRYCWGDSGIRSAVISMKPCSTGEFGCIKSGRSRASTSFQKFVNLTLFVPATGWLDCQPTSSGWFFELDLPGNVYHLAKP